MIAEAFTTTGYALEVGTALFPQNFVLLAGELMLVYRSLLLGCVARCAACPPPAGFVATKVQAEHASQGAERLCAAPAVLQLS